MEYVPPAMAKKEPTPEKLEEMRKKEARTGAIYAMVKDFKIKMQN